ncbi:MAG: TraR/DksA family transcriptional regulator [Rickettsiales bacterium]|jgi:DnaK suppressor protein|nr:TraR/DksA family transcriptional regulator [Rickettsiales bacterium]
MSNQDYKTLELPAGYKPKISEPYMCPEQKAYFFQLLGQQRQDLMEEEDELKSLAVNLNRASPTGDALDNADTDIESKLAIRTASRLNNLLKRYDDAIKRLETGAYGYSKISGDEIGIKRLMARPIAELTIAEQEAKEKNEK